MAFQTPLTIAAVVRDVQRRRYVLPAIQREFVWSDDKICALFDSLMRGYPIGSFLFWDRGRSAESPPALRIYSALAREGQPSLPRADGSPPVG